MMVLLRYVTLVMVCLAARPAAGQPGSSEVRAALTVDSARAKASVRPVVRADSAARFLEINRIFIIGNRLTRDRIILRELSIRKGDIIYNRDLAEILDLDKKKLVNTRLFNTVEIRSMEVYDNKVDLIIDVNERWYTFPAPIFELSDRNFNEWWHNYNHDFKRVNYGLRLYQFNMRGRNETLRLTAQMGYQRKFDLLYRFPYIDKRQQHGLTIDVDFRETKNLAYQTRDHKYVFAESDEILRYQTGGSLTYRYRRSFYKTHQVSLGYRHIRVNDIVIDSNANYIQGEYLTQQYPMIAYQYNADHRDVGAYPLNGHQFIYFIGHNGMGISDDIQYWETSLLYSRYIDLKKNWYLSNNTIGYYSEPRHLPYVNYGVLGYNRQFVRGYELYIIEGPWYGLNKTTLKKRIFHRDYHWASMPIRQFRHIPISIYLKTYADLGYVQNYPYYEAQGVNTRLSDKMLFGTGLGLDIVGFYDMVLRIEYSVNAEGEHGMFFHVKREF